MHREEIYNGVKYRTSNGQKYLCAGQRTDKQSRYLHRQKWIDNYGDVPSGHHIHHKDGDRFNNELFNLELIEAKEHCSQHMQKRVKENPEFFKQLAKLGNPHAKVWHASSEGIKWHIEHAKRFSFGKFEYGTKKCLLCGTTFEAKAFHSKYCKPACKTRHRNILGLDDETRECAKCGGAFMCSKYQKGRKNCDKCKRS